MDINVPIELVLKVEVPMEDYQREVLDTCLNELEAHKKLVERHVKKRIADLLSDGSLTQHVGDVVAQCVDRLAVRQVSTVTKMIQVKVDEHLGAAIEMAAIKHGGDIETRIDRQIDRAVEHAVYRLVRDRHLEQQVLDRVKDRDGNEKLNDGVDVLELTLRSRNCLRAANIDTLRQLVETTAGELRRLPNLGKKSIAEIREVLACRGLRLLGDK